MDGRWEFCLSCDEDLMPEWEYCPSCGAKLHVTIQSELEKYRLRLERYEKELSEIEKHLSAINIQKRNALHAIDKAKVKIKDLEGEL